MQKSGQSETQASKAENAENDAPAPGYYGNDKNRLKKQKHEKHVDRTKTNANANTKLPSEHAHWSAQIAAPAKLILAFAVCS